MKFKFILRALLIMLSVAGYTIMTERYDMIVPMLVVAISAIWLGYDAHDLWK